MDPLIVVALGAAVAGFVQGLSGFAFSMVAASVWAWALAPQLTGPLLVFGSFVGQVIAIPAMRRGFNLARAAPFVLGGLVGVPVGVAILPAIEPSWFRFGIGLLLVVYCPVMLAANRLPKLPAFGRLADAVVGAVGGVLGGIAGMTGAMPTLWCTLTGRERHESRAVIQSFNLAMHTTTLAAYLFTGTITAEAGRLFLVVAPAMLIPTLLGARLYAHISDASFRRVVLLLLLASGITLLAASLPVVWARIAG